MNGYESVIGLEVHAELNTKTKIYCSCRNSFGGEPNTRVCPVCMGMPGTLPVLNHEAVTKAVKMGHALNCKINNISFQDRKNYFYPDLPKAYQITQSAVPICENGHLDILVGSEIRRIRINRIHIEEDAGKLLHDESGGGSLADYNRCGVPLIEIVTEPDLRSSDEARIFLNMIRSILMYTDVSDCKMQEGSIRCDVNVSLREKGTEKIGIRCEMKNVNSFSGAVRGIEYEIQRQTAILEAGGSIVQETRRWDDTAGKSTVMRTKENAQDYRFFPEPDLRAIEVTEAESERIKLELPELPNVKVIRYVTQLGLPYADAAQIAESADKAKLFDDCVKAGRCSARGISNQIVGNITKYLNETGLKAGGTKLTADALTALVNMSESGKISSTSVQKALAVLLTEGGSAEETVDRLGLLQNSDTEYLERLADEIIAENEKSVNDYKNGRTNALGHLTGQCMKASGGRANPQLLREILINKLS